MSNTAEWKKKTIQVLNKVHTHEIPDHMPQYSKAQILKALPFLTGSMDKNFNTSVAPALEIPLIMQGIIKYQQQTYAVMAASLINILSTIDTLDHAPYDESFDMMHPAYQTRVTVDNQALATYAALVNINPTSSVDQIVVLPLGASVALTSQGPVDVSTPATTPTSSPAPMPARKLVISMPAAPLSPASYSKMVTTLSAIGSEPPSLTLDFPALPPSKAPTTPTLKPITPSMKPSTPPLEPITPLKLEQALSSPARVPAGSACIYINHNVSIKPITALSVMLTKPAYANDLNEPLSYAHFDGQTYEKCSNTPNEKEITRIRKVTELKVATAVPIIGRNKKLARINRDLYSLICKIADKGQHVRTQFKPVAGDKDYLYGARYPLYYLFADGCNKDIILLNKFVQLSQSSLVNSIIKVTFMGDPSIKPYIFNLEYYMNNRPDNIRNVPTYIIHDNAIAGICIEVERNNMPFVIQCINEWSGANAVPTTYLSFKGPRFVAKRILN